jgi:hypothetical protein
VFTITVQSRSRYSRRDTVRYEKFTLLRLERNFHCNRKHNFDKLYFIFDLARYHITPKVLNHLEKNNIEAIIVPPRFTIGVLNYVMNLAQFIIKSYLAN